MTQTAEMGNVHLPSCGGRGWSQEKPGDRRDSVATVKATLLWKANPD